MIGDEKMDELRNKILSDLSETASFYGSRWPSGGGREAYRNKMRNVVDAKTALEIMGVVLDSVDCPISVPLFIDLSALCGINCESVVVEVQSRVSHIPGPFRSVKQALHWRLPCVAPIASLRRPG